MGRTSFGNTPDVLRLASAILTTTPVTMAGWFKPASFATIHSAVGIFNSASASPLNEFGLRFGSSPAGCVEALTGDGATSVKAQSSTTTAGGSWVHACGVWASATDRRAFLNGGGKGTNATSVTPSGLNRTSVGLIDNVTSAFGLFGQAAEVGIWNVALADADVASLATGASPLLIRPDALVLYCPLYGQSSPEQSWRGTGLTIVGGVTDAFDHPAMLAAS